MAARSGSRCERRILSTSSIVLGVAAAHETHRIYWLQEWPAWLPGYVDGSREYVSVHSQKDTERADLSLERVELKQTIKASTRNWRRFTLPWTRSFSRETGAQQLMAHDALVLMPAMSWVSRRRFVRVQFKQRCHRGKLRTRRFDASLGYSDCFGQEIDPGCIRLFLGVARTSGGLAARAVAG